VAAVVVVGAAGLLARQTVGHLTNRLNRELASNGLLSFVTAFRANAVSYEDHYSTLPAEEAMRRARGLIGHGPGVAAPDDTDGLVHAVRSARDERHWNVIQITVESLSASYLGVFGNRNQLTPVLDGIAARSLFFTQCFATGTRTVRGMEALTLSVPPTPGASLVRRPGNEGLFSTGSLFRERGYDTRFIYSGFGYFDNMNYFFSYNGFDVVDRASGHAAPVTFANVWGACDEDLYAWVTEAADKAAAAGKPFYHFVMTTSNHRPYTFPEGAIDRPQGHRGSAVRYTDYAIGRFLEAASRKPWFRNTLIVITADHCSSSAGKTDIPIGKYHIPLLVYNPELVPARRVDTLCSQIDVAPTLLALLDWSYDSRFYGRDILATAPEDGRALVSTYQALGYLKGGVLTVLGPRRREEAFRCDLSTFAMQPRPVDAALRDDTIAYYQSASQLLHHGLLKRLTHPGDTITRH
jgi:arylsulfatase A-like enzyme